MAATSDARILPEVLERDEPAAAAAKSELLQEVVIDSTEREREREHEGDGEAMIRPPRAFDYVELPKGVAVSTPFSSEGGLQRLWEGGLFDVSEHTDVTLHTAWYVSISMTD